MKIHFHLVLTTPGTTNQHFGIAAQNLIVIIIKCREYQTWKRVDAHDSFQNNNCQISKSFLNVCCVCRICGYSCLLVNAGKMAAVVWSANFYIIFLFFVFFSKKKDFGSSKQTSFEGPSANNWQQRWTVLKLIWCFTSINTCQYLTTSWTLPCHCILRIWRKEHWLTVLP